eukprot:189860_1
MVFQIFKRILRCIYGIFIILLMLFGILLMCLHLPLHFVHVIFTVPCSFTFIKPLYTYYGLTYLAFILEYLCGIKFHICISPQTYYFIEEFKTLKSPGSILISMNHRTRVDWMMIWVVLVRFDIVQYLVTVARMLLRFLPIIGWVFAWIGIFLKRNWVIDKPILLNMIRVLGSRFIQPRAMFLFFAEGTDLWQKAIKHSNKYALKSNLPKYKYVLHPRTRGFVKIIQELNDNLFAILDITIGYVDFVPGERCNELLLAQGRYCKQVFFYIETFTVDDIIEQHKNDLNKPFYKPCEYVKKELRQKYIQILDGENKQDIQMVDNAISDFVKKSFEKKEMKLKQFYENGKWFQNVAKIDYNFFPRSHYFIALCVFFVHLIGFVWLWNNMRWYIWLACCVHVVASLTDAVGRIIRSYRPWVDKMEKANKEKLKKKSKSIGNKNYKIGNILNREVH